MAAAATIKSLPDILSELRNSQTQATFQSLLPSLNYHARNNAPLGTAVAAARTGNISALVTELTNQMAIADEAGDVSEGGRRRKTRRAKRRSTRRLLRLLSRRSRSVRKMRA